MFTKYIICLIGDNIRIEGPSRQTLWRHKRQRESELEVEDEGQSEMEKGMRISVILLNQI